MKLSTKIFAGLVVFSLVPLFVFNFLSNRVALRLGNRVSGDVRQELTAIIGKELQLAAEHYSQILYSDFAGMQFAILQLAREAEEALGKPAPKKRKLYFAPDFDSPETAPPDVGPPPYEWKGAGAVSLEHPVIYLPKGVDRAGIRADAERIAGLTGNFREIYNAFPGAVRWVYLSLQKGVHVSYPGHGGYPEDYDPRKRVWYRAVAKQGKDVRMRGLEGVVGTGPMFDATTGGVVFTASTPLHDSQGKVTGVAALDVPLDAVLKDIELSSRWSSDMQSFLVEAAVDPKTGKEGLKIVARRELRKVQSRWRGSPAAQWAYSSDSEALERIVGDVRGNRSGIVEAPFEGTESIWAYAPLGVKHAFIIMVPMSIAEALPDRISSQVSGLTKTVHYRTAGLAAVLLVLVGIVAFWGARTFSRDIGVVLSAWERLGEGDFSVRLNIRSNDERDLMYQAFNETVPKLEEHLRMSKSLGLAQEVQRSLLPAASPEFAGFDIAGHSLYCDETGGDYFDFIRLGENGDRLGVVLGDVSGHGVPSALLMASARACLRQRLAVPGDPGKAIGDVNRLISRDTYASGQFVTLFYFELTRGGGMTWVRAGHDPALLYDPERGEFSELSAEGIPLGVVGDFEFTPGSGRLSPGQVLFVGTDGIWEQTGPDGAMFGRERVWDIIRDNAYRPAQDIIGAILEAHVAFRGDVPVEDDVTMVVIKMS